MPVPDIPKVKRVTWCLSKLCPKIKRGLAKNKGRGVFLMERVMTVEEKIRRAEEIYQRRREGETRPIAKVAVNEKKDVRLLKKMVIQILICVTIYFIVYVIQNNQYVFSEDFINKANEILSYDVNFAQLYEMVKNNVMAFVNKEDQNKMQEQQTDEIPKQEDNQSQTTEGEGNSEGQEEKQEQEQNQGNDAIGGAEAIQEENKNLSQDELDIQNVKNTTGFIKPVNGVVSSKYGQRDTATGNVPKNHTGTDIAANLGTKIISATDGEVVLSSEEGDYGKHLKIQIGEVSVIYAHCNQLYVKQGDKIKQGQEIAEVGSTGNSTGPHLHFEIRISERKVDPQKILEL